MHLDEMFPISATDFTKKIKKNMIIFSATFTNHSREFVAVLQIFIETRSEFIVLPNELRTSKQHGLEFFSKIIKATLQHRILLPQSGDYLPIIVPRLSERPQINGLTGLIIFPLRQPIFA